MKKYSIILLISIIGIFFSSQFTYADTSSAWATVDGFMLKLDRKVVNYSLPQKIEYYTTAINKLEDQINQYRNIQDILRWRIANKISLPSWTITWAVIDNRNFSPASTWSSTSVWNIRINSIEFQAKDCLISIGGNTCISTLYVSTPAWKTFSVKNVTRGITSVNFITPNNYHTVAGWDQPIYVVSGTSQDDSANILKYGENRLELIENGNTIATSITLASCSVGSKWNGKICEHTTDNNTPIYTIDPITPSQNTQEMTPAESPYSPTNPVKPHIIRPFTLTSYVTKQGEFNYSGWIIKYNSQNDEYLTLKGSGPRWPILIYSNQWEASSRTSISKGTWEFWNINSNNFLIDGLKTYTLWDGKNESTKINIPIQTIVDGSRYNSIERRIYRRGGSVKNNYE